MQKRKQIGFTLIELMIVIAIIAIIAAIAVPNFIRARARGQLTACATNLKNIGTALEMYSVDYSSRYPVNTSALTPNYIKLLPECPSAGSDTYSTSYTPSTTPDDYELFCEGSFHGNIVPTDYPQFGPESGLVER